MKMSTGAVLVAVTFALSACGGSHRATSGGPRLLATTLPAPLVKLIHSFSTDTRVSGKQVVVYGPDSRYLLVKASSGDLVQKTARERKGFYLIVLHGHFVGDAPYGAKPPHGTIETQVWSATEGVTDTGISYRLPAAVSRLHRAAVVALRASGSGPPGARISTQTVSSSRLILDGRVRCTATVSRSVQAGSPLGLTFAVRNVSNRTATVLLADGGLWLVVKATDGTTYDTRVPLRNEIGGVPFPTRLAPGATKTWPAGRYLPVRWTGPLRVTPGCLKTALPALSVAVKAPGPPPDERTAVADVVAASGHLLDHCRPERAGVAVRGLIYPPSGGAPPMSATCSVNIQREGTFLVAQVLIASPPGAHYVHVRQPYEQLTVHHASPYETTTWAFVVTKNGTIPVAAAEADATKPGKGRETYWSLSGSHWQNAGDGVCGGSGGMGGPNPMIDFISACPA